MWPGQSHEQWWLLRYLEHNHHALFHSAVLNVLLCTMSLGLLATSCINDTFINVRRKEAICQGSQTQVSIGPTQMLLISKQTWPKEKLGVTGTVANWGASGPSQEGSPFSSPRDHHLLFYRGSQKSRFPRELSQVLKVSDITHEFLKILCVPTPCKPNKTGMGAESGLQAVPPYHSDFYCTDHGSIVYDLEEF